MKIEHVQEISASVSDVWGLTVDVESLPDLTSTITKVGRLEQGPLGIGSEVLIKQPGQRERVWTVNEFEPERRFAWTTKAIGLTMTGCHDLRRSDTGTSNTLTIELTGTLAPVVGPLIQRSIRKALATENEGFRVFAEDGGLINQAKPDHNID